jgi:light-regulated signal transduction histidine kinase (bacteriophytochrome)
MTRPVFAVDTLNVQAITKQFAELLGGSIGVESQVGKGSTFRVRVLVVYREG